MDEQVILQAIAAGGDEAVRLLIWYKVLDWVGGVFLVLTFVGGAIRIVRYASKLN